MRIVWILVLVGLTAGIYFWLDHRYDEQYDRAVDDVVLAYQGQIDSLQHRLEQLSRAREQQFRWDDKTAQARDSVYQELRIEIDFLRGRLKRMVKQTLAESGVDPLGFYLARLGDSTFVSHAGDYDRPEVWRFAAEELGQMGKRAVGPLIERLNEPASDYEREQTLYALLLLSGHTEILEVTRGESPVDLRNTEYHKLDKVAAWNKWWGKFGDRLER